MKKQTIILLGVAMILIGLLSSFHFFTRLQGLFQSHLSHYSRLFEKGQTVRCLYLDITMFLYIASLLFKNLYYVMGGVMILFFTEFGRELGLLGAVIGLVTEVSFRLMFWVGSDPSVVTPFSITPFFLFLIGISIHITFFYLLTRRPMVENLKRSTP